MDVLEVVAAYENLGLRCFPVRPDKKPFGSWEPCRTETTEQRLARFERTTPPFLIAAVPGDQFVVVDVDNPEAFRDFFNGEPVSFSGPVVLTPSGGWHYWCRQGHDLRLSFASFPWGELRTGDGHYCIVPGGDVAEYEKGGRAIRGTYQWTPGTTPLTEWQGELPDLPAGLLSRVERKDRLSQKPSGEGESIPEGQRNNRLTSLAGTMRRAGMSETEIFAALWKVNEERCIPPLADKELQGIAKSIGKKNPSELAGIERVTDSGNAEYLAALFGDRLRFDHKRLRWLVWREHWWEPDVDGEVRRLAVEAARKRQSLANEIEDKDARAKVFNWGISSESRNKVDAALYLAQAVKPFADKGDNWDLDRWLLGVQNGVIDLRTGELRDGKPGDRVTKHCPVAYAPEAHPDRWLQFLFEVFQNDEPMVNFVQRAVGYSLTGDTREQCFFLLHGGGQNGKSVFLEMLRHVLGPYSWNVAFSALEKHGRYSITNELADIAEARLVTASETNEGARLNEARLKAMTGGDRLTARKLYQNSFEYDPQYKLWLSCNHRPVVRDDSFAFWRRVLLIPFLQRFVPREKMQPGDLDADENLVEKLKAEDTAILTWAVEGCLLWQEKRLSPPEAVRAASEKYRQESDPLSDFLSECCVPDPGKTTRAGELFKAYQNWCESQKLDRRDVLTRNGFAERIQTRFARDEDKKGRFYHGIGLHDELFS